MSSGLFDAQPIDDADGVAITSLRATGEGETPSVPYRGGARRRRFGLDDDEDGLARRFDRWRDPEGK